MITSKVLNIIGVILILLGLSMLPSSLWGIFLCEEFKLTDSNYFDFIAIVKSSSITILFGLALYFITK